MRLAPGLLTIFLSCWRYGQSFEESFMKGHLAFLSPPLQSISGSNRNHNHNHSNETKTDFNERIGRIRSSRFLALRQKASTRLIHGCSTIAPNLSLTSTLRKKRKALLLGTALLWFTWTTVQAIQTKNRQRIDPTSEWARYARNPGARGRALGNLLLKVTPLYFLSCAVGSRWGFRKPTWREQILQYSGRLLADGLLRVGPLYVKLGQILSSQQDFLPAPWIQQLERLTDQVPAKSGEEAIRLAHSAWPGGSLSFNATFVDFESIPLAAASLGQVHTAVLRKTGETVALKLQRPFLRAIYDQDISFLIRMAKMMDRFGGSSQKVGGIEQSWTAIFEDAKRILYREIDYRDEAENGQRVSTDFGLTQGGVPSPEGSMAQSRDGEPLPSAASWLRTPTVYSDLSSEKVLVMEYVPGIQFSRQDKLDAAGVTDADKVYLADCLARAYLRQFCCHGFFSSDPHVGNVAVEMLNANATQPAQRVRLILYDFGQAASLQPDQCDGILEIVQAIVDTDVESSVMAFQKMGVLKSNADLNVVRSVIASNYATGKVKANRKRMQRSGLSFEDKNRDEGNVISLQDTSNIANANIISVPADSVKSSSEISTRTTSSGNTPVTRNSNDAVQYFTLPAEYAFAARAVTQLTGVGKLLDPEFDFISASAPFMYEIKGTGKYIKDEVAKRVNKVDEKFKEVLSTFKR